LLAKQEIREQLDVGVLKIASNQSCQQALFKNKEG
jgi:hypothetical protein